MLSKIAMGFVGTLLAAATGAFVFWGPQKKRPKDKFCGLLNVGNSCFLNALLQAWAASPSLYNWLLHVKEDSVQNKCQEGLLTSTIFKVIKVLNNEDETASNPYDPSVVFHALKAKRWVITSEEQDSHELFHVLTQTLDEEATRYPSIVSLFDVTPLEDPKNEYQDKHRAFTRSKSLLPVLPARQIEGPTRGLLASQLQCLTCGLRSPVKYDSFDSLSLNIPRNCWGSLSLDSLLKQYIQPEIVHDVDCVGCSKITGRPKVKANFRKKISLGKLPQVFCIHLPRTQWMDNGAVVKRFDHIHFPDILVMDQYLYNHTADADESGMSCKKGLAGGVDAGLKRIRPRSNLTSVSPQSSAAVNLLRTLHFDQQFTGTGLFLTSHGSPQIPRELSDINHNAPPSDPEQLLKSNTSLPEFSFRLAAVVCHLGDVQLGHYVTYRRGVHAGAESPKGAAGLSNKWWFTSDSSVHRVSSQQVFASEAYMLFYERVHHV